MKVFVQYCGGCNPCIDRVRVVKELICSANGLELGEDGESSEWWLMMNGCEVNCREFEGNPPEGKVLVVAGCLVQGEDVAEKDIPAALLQRIRKESA